MRPDILKIFAKSPFKPLQEHMALILLCVERLDPFFTESLKPQVDWVRVEALHQEIMAIESKADDLKKQIRLQLPNGIFMPVARTDILGLLSAQDKIASKAKHLSGLLLARKIRIPDLISNQYLSFIRLCIDATRQASKAINELDELIETGFKGRDVRTVEDMIMQLDSVERDTDELQVEFRNKLFEAEKDFDPVDVIFLYKVIDWTAELADKAQHVGHRLESIVAQ